MGNITDTVTAVNESAPLLKTESAEISHTVTNDDADDLPVLTIGGLGGFAGLRDPMQMSILLPGVSYTTDTVLRVNGIPSGTEAIRIEGQDATNNMFNGQTSVTEPRRGRNPGSIHPNQQFCSRVWPGGGRVFQLHHAVGHQPVPWQRLRLPAE